MADAVERVEQLIREFEPKRPRRDGSDQMAMDCAPDAADFDSMEVEIVEEAPAPLASPPAQPAPTEWWKRKPTHAVKGTCRVCDCLQSPFRIYLGADPAFPAGRWRSQSASSNFEQPRRQHVHTSSRCARMQLRVVPGLDLVMWFMQSCVTHASSCAGAAASAVTVDAEQHDASAKSKHTKSRRDGQHSRPNKPVTDAHAQTQWLRNYPWLELAKDAAGKLVHDAIGYQKGFCMWCVKHRMGDPSNEWVDKSANGPGGARLGDGNNMKRHQDSAGHKAAAEKELGAKHMVQAMNNARVVSLHQAAHMLPLFMCVVLMMVVEGLPVMKFPAQVALCVVAGAEIRHKYSHSRYFWSFGMAVSEALLCAQLARIRQSPFFAIMLDSSTDVSQENHQLLYVRYMDPHTWQVFTEYVCCAACANKTAEAIYELVRLLMRVLGMDHRKLVGWASDGDSTMIGCRTGVATRLRNAVCNYLVVVHCCAHRSALVMSDVGARVEWLKDEVDGMLKGVHALFARSPGKQASWSKFCAQYGVTKCHFPVFNRTRWMSRKQCVAQLRTALPYLIKLIEQYDLHVERWPQGVALLPTLRDVNFVARLHALHDMLDIVGRLMLYFQTDNTLVHRINHHVQACIRDLQHAFFNVQPKLTSSAAAVFVRQWDSATNMWRFAHNKQVGLLGTLNEHQVMQDVAAVASEVIAGLRERFADAAFLENFRVFDPAEYRSLDVANPVALREFGQHEILALLARFVGKDLPDDGKLFAVGEAVGVTSDGLFEEFEQFKQMMNLKAGLQLGMLDTLRVIAVDNAIAAQRFPHMIMLAQVAVILSMQTASIERGFSTHRVIKHRLTNRLKAVSIDILMRLRLLGPRNWQHFKEHPLCVEACNLFHAGNATFTTASLHARTVEAAMDSLPTLDAGFDFVPDGPDKDTWAVPDAIDATLLPESDDETEEVHVLPGFTGNSAGVDHVGAVLDLNDIPEVAPVEDWRDRLGI